MIAALTDLFEIALAISEPVHISCYVYVQYVQCGGFFSVVYCRVMFVLMVPCVYPGLLAAPAFVREWGWGVEGKQVGSMDEESQVRGCYNITFICTPASQD